jgi:hypothetical protein
MSRLNRITHALRGLLQFERRMDEIKINQARILSTLQRTSPDGPLWTH